MILEYPFNGVITRMETTMFPNGDTEETQIEIYNGSIDVALSTPEIGTLAQTSNYIVSMPLIATDSGYIIPKKDDRILVNMYGDIFSLSVNNIIVSQLGGITVYASRGTS